MQQEQKTKNELQAKLQELQIDYKAKLDEIDNLNFNNARLSKRIDSLQEQLNAKVIHKPQGHMKISYNDGNRAHKKEAFSEVCSVRKIRS